MSNQPANGPIDEELPPIEAYAMARVEQPNAVAGVAGGQHMDVARIAMEVQAQVICAHKFPRNEETAVNRLISACARPAMADVALYEYNRGKKKVKNDKGVEYEVPNVIVGPSIRLAEEAARCWGNIQHGWRITAQNMADGWSDLEAFAWDTESGLRPSMTWRVHHYRATKTSRYKLTDSRDIYEMLANEAARRMRKCILQVIPAYVQEMALAEIKRTIAGDGSAEHLGKEGQVVAAFFEGYGVQRADLEKYIGHSLDDLTPDDLIKLRAAASSIKDGERTAYQVFGSGDGKPTEDTTKVGNRIGAGLNAARDASRIKSS